MKRVFLGGTCNNSVWRKKLIPMLKISYFNPVVSDWNEKAKQNEIYERENCDYCLYTITPSMKGVYSIAEVIDDSNKRPEKTIFCVLIERENGKIFDSQVLNSLKEVGKMVERNGGKYFEDLYEVSKYLNGK